MNSLATFFGDEDVLVYSVAISAVVAIITLLVFCRRSNSTKKLATKGASATPKTSQKTKKSSRIQPESEKFIKQLKSELPDIEDVMGRSLIPTTLKGMKKRGLHNLTPEEKIEKREMVENLGLEKFAGVLSKNNIKLDRVPTTVFQMNIGLYCNQACSHCHVDSSPRRKEMMHRDVADQCLKIIKNSPSIKTVDLTGGAPELNQQFRYIVEESKKLGKEVIDRCNLTVLLEPHQHDLADFLAYHKVRIVASLPCYQESNVDSQRGDAVFTRSITALRMLNTLGYGTDPELSLDLVYNPTGIHLPPSQQKLQSDYKRILKKDYNIVFNSLFCIANMPINRYTDHLVTEGKLEYYVQLLIDNFNAKACTGLMCRSHISVKYDGGIFDCDFNQQIELPITKRSDGSKKSLTVFDLNSTNDIINIPIITKSHCFGCTAGAGSSCQGATI